MREKFKALALDEQKTLNTDRLAELLESEAKLRALEAGGVDNWQWYDQSLEDAHFFDD